MKLKHHILTTALALALSPTMAMAQANGTNSSYSRFGIGLPCDQSQSYNRSMAGVAQGLRKGTRVNMQNPASYSAIDSLTFLFDVGMGLQRTRFTQNGSHRAANNTSFDQVNAAFRVARNLGMSIGFQPYTKVGYSFTQTQDVSTDPYTGQAISNVFEFNGSGGIHQAYIGAGWRPFKGFSIGVNAGVIWGTITHQLAQTFAENGTANTTSYSSLRTYYSSNVISWKGDVGLQYALPLKQDDRLTIGATVGIGHRLGGTSSITRTALSGDTIQASTGKAFSIPMSYSIGGAWEHAEKLTLAADFTLEQWSKCYAPVFNVAERSYNATTGAYSDHWRISAGAEYVPNRFGNLAQRISYRMGAYYSSPYLNIAQGGQTVSGPCEYGLTAGVGIPILNSTTQRFALRPQVNVGVGWSRRTASAAGLINENILSIHIGVTFNERWFMKWQFK